MARNAVTGGGAARVVDVGDVDDVDVVVVDVPVEAVL